MINEQIVKLVEINFSEDIVHFYKFDSFGNPIYESYEGEVIQGTFVPGEANFEDYVANLAEALIVNALTIQSSQEFSFQIYYGNISDWEMVLQLCYDGDSNYRFYEHHELDEPFDANSQIGDFSILFVGEETYTGYNYSVNPLEVKWDKTDLQGNNSDSIYAETYTGASNTVKGCVRSKIEGTTSSGKHVKIEDKWDGKGPKVYKGEDKNGDGDYDDEGEHITDQEEIEDIMDEVSSDLENGLGDYEGEAWDDNGTPDDTSDDIPIDAIIWFKNSDGTYSGLKITRNGSGGWDLGGKNRVSAQWMKDHYYLPKYADDTNPTGAWFVGGNKPGYPNYAFGKYARFDENGNLDPDGEQKPYHFAGYGKYTPIPYDPSEEYYRLSDFNDFWPPLP
jgi:hypothetical protein